MKNTGYILIPKEDNHFKVGNEYVAIGLYQFHRFRPGVIKNYYAYKIELTGDISFYCGPYREHGYTDKIKIIDIFYEP
jgi:hypothetical protein